MEKYTVSYIFNLEVEAEDQDEAFEKAEQVFKKRIELENENLSNAYSDIHIDNGWGY